MKHPVRIHALMSTMSAVTDCKNQNCSISSIYLWVFANSLFAFYHSILLFHSFILIPLVLFLPDSLCTAGEKQKSRYTYSTTLTEYMKYISNELKVLDNPKPHNARNVDSDVAMPYSFPHFWCTPLHPTYGWLVVCEPCTEFINMLDTCQVFSNM